MIHSTQFKMITVFLLTLGLLSAGPVAAQKDHEDMNVSIQMHLSRAKQSLAETVLKSEQMNANVFEAKLDHIDNILTFEEEAIVYKLITMKNGEVTKQFIDPMSGKEQDSKKLSFISFWGEGYKKINFDTMKISMSQAIKLVEEESNGVAFEAELDERDGIWNYQVSIVGKDGITRYLVDPLTGKLFKKYRNHETGDRS